MTAPRPDVMVDDLVPGDVLLVTAQPKNDWAKLILALDGAEGRFSRCGIALGDGRILSSRPFLRPWWRPLDLGGLIEEDLDHFWDLDQLVHRIDVDPVEHADAVARLPRYDARAGSFSMSKIVAIAATLHALRIRRPLPPKDQARIVRRAVTFAEAWCADDFFCAEFVAQLYDWEFTLGDLQPPESYRPVHVPLFGQLLSDIVPVAIAPWLADEKKDTLQGLVYEVRRRDAAFFGGAPLDVLLEKMARFFGVKITDPDPMDDVELDLENTTVPWGLVTPRMVLSKHQGAHPPPLVRRRRSSAH